MTGVTAPTLRDIFTIPESTGTDDFVLRLSSSVQADQVAADSINRRSRCFASHAAAPFAARRLPTAS